MSRRWVIEKHSDPYYRRAKREGYKSRAAYKLKQIQERHEVIRLGDRVLDLGAAPGGWLQVALELVGERGVVVGADLQRISGIPGAVTVKGDVTVAEVQEQIIAAAGGQPFDVVLSDMAPDMSGAYSTDHARSVHLAQTAHEVARRISREGGCFVVKVFDGDLLNGFVSELKASYRFVRRFSPAASRERSAEIYIVCKGMLRRARPMPPQQPVDDDE